MAMIFKKYQTGRGMSKFLVDQGLKIKKQGRIYFVPRLLQNEFVNPQNALKQEY